jgi:hypothetical protein
MSSPLVERSSHGLRVKASAESIFYFLKSTVEEVEGANVAMDREALLLYLEGFKSPYFMRLVEEDPDLPYDIKIQISHMVSGLSKTWPAVNTLVYDSSALRFAAVIWQFTRKLEQIKDALGIQVVIDADAELLPTELPPGEEE